MVGGRLTPRHRLTGDEIAFLKQHAPGADQDDTASAIQLLGSELESRRQRCGVRLAVRDAAGRRAHPARGGRGLVADGVDYIQLDAPFYGVFIDEQHRADAAQDGIDPDRALEEVVAADNAVIDGLARDGLTLALHICRGNSRSRWLYEGGYDPIAEVLFSQLGVDTFLLEYDSPRDGDFAPLRFLPAGKTAVLGLVTSKEPGLETVR